ncbi:MAG: hypothetical protein ACJ789_01555 [Thermomicrobiales bacterium]
MARRVWVGLVVAGALLLALMAGGIGPARSLAASQGCDAVNSLGPFAVSDYSIPDFSWEAGEKVSFAATPYTGSPTTSQLFVNSWPVATGPVPGTLTYLIPSTGPIAEIRFLPNGGSVMLTVTCVAPQTATPTFTPTNSPTPTSMNTPVSTEAPTTTTPAETPMQDATATATSATATPTTTPTKTATATPSKTPTATATPQAGVSMTPTRQTVNSFLHYTIIGFPHNAPVQITWRRLSGSIIAIATVQSSATGTATGVFRVPATTGGKGQLITFTSGSVSKTVSVEVAPRIKIIENSVQRGQFVDVSLRGYAKKESVRIRWQQGTSWVTLATVLTSNTGSANVMVKVPSFAPDGLNSVRGDGTVFRQQTNAVNVQGGPGPTAGASSATAPGQSEVGFHPETTMLAIPALSLGYLTRRRIQTRTRT